MKPSQAAPVRVSSHIDGHRHPCLYRPFRILDDHFCFQEEELPRSRKSPNFFSAILDYMNTLCQSAHRVDRFCAPFTKIRNGVFTTLRTPFTRLRNLTHSSKRSVPRRLAIDDIPVKNLLVTRVGQWLAICSASCFDFGPANATMSIKASTLLTTATCASGICSGRIMSAGLVVP